MEQRKTHEYKEVFTDWVDRADFAEMVYRIETALRTAAVFVQIETHNEKSEGDWIQYYVNKGRDGLWEAMCNTKAVMKELQSRIDERDADIVKLAAENAQLRALLDASGGN